MKQILAARPRLALSVLLFPASLLAAPAAWASPAELPPLGLYRIDTDGSFSSAGNPVELRMKTDGQTGDASARWTLGAASATRQFKGGAPVTHCVKSVTGGTLPMPPQAAACKVESMTRTREGFSQTSSCPFGKLSVTVRQLDQERWEFVTQMAMHTTGAAPNLAVLEPMLRQQAAHGETPEVRARASAQLAALPQMQKQGDATYAATIAKMNDELRRATDPQEKAAIRMALDRMQPGTPTIRTGGRMVWTRISNSCDGVK